MRCYPVRYFKVTIIIGAFVALVVALLYEGGLFVPADSALANVTLQNYVPAWHRGIQYPLFTLFAFVFTWSVNCFFKRMQTFQNC